MSISQGFALWITGLPASGKSSIAKALVNRLDAQGIRTVVLESDEMRNILTPHPDYGEEERDAFYRSLAMIGEVITKRGIHVIFDATAHKQCYRDLARTRIPRFMEIYVYCPIDTCLKRDPKGIYSRASAGTATSVPGLQVTYEPPTSLELTLDCQAPLEIGVQAILDKLRQLSYI